MPQAKYINALIGGKKLDLESVDGFPLSIDYKLEDPENFQNKKSSQALSIKVPATTNNDEVANTFHNPSIEDMTEGEVFRNFQKAIIEANGYEILVGKAILTQARHASCPLSYEWDFYGNNADWIIPLKESTIYDFLNDIVISYTKQHIIDTWQYDGTDSGVPYSFLPVRYGLPMEQKKLPNNNDVIDDYNMRADYMKPSLSIYWLLYRGFKSIGYRISSDFFNTDYFRRMLMPWTWGNFLFSQGTQQDNLDFLAKSVRTTYYVENGQIIIENTGEGTGFADCHVENDYYDGAFDNNNVYEYDAANKAMKWTYLPSFNYGSVDATFNLRMYFDSEVTGNSSIDYRVQWFKNGVRVDTQTADGNPLLNLQAPAIGIAEYVGLVDEFMTINVVPGDVIEAKIWYDYFATALGRVDSFIAVDAFQFEYFRIPIGGFVDFQYLTGLKKFKFLDFLAGVIDSFNLSIQTDPVSKTVFIEPTHDYSLTNDLSIRSGGYFNGKWIDWNQKQDISRESVLELFSESERELLFKFKEDTTDGLLKKIQDRNSTIVGQSKYVFPDRFKAGKKEMTNRFFSPVVHCEMTQWKGLGNTGSPSGSEEFSPQIVCLVPENISNTSREEAQNTFQPKLCYYKGIVNYVGWSFDGDELDYYPYMFAVNYQEGGEEDPVLSYGDELISPVTDPIIAKGLLRRFFLQRLAVMRNGQYYKTPLRLNNLDVTNWLHREHKIIRGQKWELVEINGYKPLKEESTYCYLRKHVPVAQKDSDAVFPSSISIEGTDPVTSNFDMKYSAMKCLKSDIPTVIP